MKSPSIGVYRIVFIVFGESLFGESYVGGTTNFLARKRWHDWGLNKGTHRSEKLQTLWAKFGATAFCFEILEECPLEKLKQREQFWIDELRAAVSGFNTRTKAGEPKAKESEQSRRKRSLAAKRLWASSEYRKACEISAKRVGADIEERKRRSDRILGNKFSEGCSPSLATRAKISKSLKGKLSGVPKTAEHRRNTSQSLKKYYKTHRSGLKGRKWTVQARKKLSKACKNAFTPERRRLVSDAMKKRWALKKNGNLI